ncbi:RNA polymerase sigma factor [Nocardioides sp.]|uniref:RNA polymerase sigma factor n=1 Tax=Nocardioides sp. TaxID=35761 RepID=UPI0039E54ED8
MDPGAFEQFVVLTYTRLRSQVAKRVPAADVDDVLQETLKSLWESDQPNPTSDDDVDRLRALAYRLAERRIADHWRTASKRERSLGAARQGYVEAVTPSALDSLLTQTPPEWLRELSSEALEVLTRYLRGFGVQEIANELGLTPNAVSLRLKRIRERLLVVLEKEVAGELDS